MFALAAATPLSTIRNEKAEKEAKMRQQEAEKAERDRLQALHDELEADKRF